MPKLNMQFVETVAATLRENATKKGEGGGGGNLPELKWYQWRDGNNMLRILEPWMDDGRFALLYFTHFQIPPDRSRHVCIAQTWPEKKLTCDICEVITDAKKKNLWELVSRYTPGGYAYVNAVDLYDMDKGVQIADLRLGMYNRLMEMMTERSPIPPYLHLYNPDGHGDITDMEKGHGVIIKKSYKGSGKDQKTEYATSLFPTPSPAHPDPEVRKAWLASRYQIEKIKKFPVEEAVQAMRAAAQAFRGWVVARATGPQSAPTVGAPTVGSTATAPATVPATAAAHAPTDPPAQPAKSVHPDIAAMEAVANAQVASAAASPTAPVAPPPIQTQTAPATTPPPATTTSTPPPTTGKRAKPDCYEKEWREGAAQPPKCMPCPWEVPCSHSVKKKIAAGEIKV